MSKVFAPHDTLSQLFTSITDYNRSTYNWDVAPAVTIDVGHLLCTDKAKVVITWVRKNRPQEAKPKSPLLLKIRTKNDKQ